MASPGGKTYSYGPHAEQRLRVTLPPRGLKKVRVWRERESLSVRPGQKQCGPPFRSCLVMLQAGSG
jgi:hypothetical protein